MKPEDAHTSIHGNSLFSIKGLGHSEVKRNQCVCVIYRGHTLHFCTDCSEQCVRFRNTLLIFFPRWPFLIVKALSRAKVYQALRHPLKSQVPFTVHVTRYLVFGENEEKAVEWTTGQKGYIHFLTLAFSAGKTSVFVVMVTHRSVAYFQDA